MGILSNLIGAGGDSTKKRVDAFSKWWVMDGSQLSLIDAMEKYIQINQLADSSLREAVYDIHETRAKVHLLRASKKHIITCMGEEQYDQLLDMHAKLFVDYKKLAEYSDDDLDKDLDYAKDKLASRFFNWWREEKVDLPISDALMTFITDHGLLDHIPEAGLLYESELNTEKLRIFTQCENAFKPLLGEAGFKQLCDSCRSVINLSKEKEGSVESADINSNFFDWWWVQQDVHVDNLYTYLNTFIEAHHLEPLDEAPSEDSRYAGRKMDIIIACRRSFELHFDSELIDSYIINLSGHKMKKEL